MTNVALLNFKTANQEKLFNTMESNDVTFCIGPAGTGKSYVSVYYALKQLAAKGNGIDGIILCRPMTCLDNESIGYLPGDIGEKVDPFMWAY